MFIVVEIWEIEFCSLPFYSYYLYPLAVFLGVRAFKGIVIGFDQPDQYKRSYTTVLTSFVAVFGVLMRARRG